MRTTLLAILAAIALATLGGCGGADLGDCPPDSDAQQLEGKTVLENECNTCHSKAGSQADSEAYGEYDFSSLSTVRDEAEEMYGEAEEGEMPPNKGLTAAQIEALRVYLACGATAQ